MRHEWHSTEVKIIYAQLYEKRHAPFSWLPNMALTLWLVGLQEPTAVGIVLVCVNLATALASLAMLIGTMLMPRRLDRHVQAMVLGPYPPNRDEVA